MNCPSCNSYIEYCWLSATCPTCDSLVISNLNKEILCFVVRVKLDDVKLSFHNRILEGKCYVFLGDSFISLMILDEFIYHDSVKEMDRIRKLLIFS